MGRFTRRQVTGSLLSAALLSRTSPGEALQPAANPTSDEWATLRRETGQDVIGRGDALYADVRQSLTWNKRVSEARTPAAIVRARSADDVVAAVRYAKSRSLKIAVRSGGHNYHGSALRDGGMLLDMSGLDAISLDASQRRASFGPGLRGGAITTALAPSGLAFPVGHCSDVGLGGYLLNGGFGLNMGEWGAACMSVSGMQMVTADGRLIHADEHENKDLFWAARGAGPGFFAVVTRFDVRLYTRPKAVHIFTAMFTMESAPSVARYLAAAIPKVHPRVEVVALLGPVDESRVPVITIMGIGIGASDAEARAQVAALRSLPAGAKLIGQPQEMSSTYADSFAAVDAGFPNGKRMAGDQVWSEASPIDLMAVASRFMTDMPPPPSNVTLVYVGGGGRVAMPAADQAALSVGGGTFIGAYAFWDDPNIDGTSKAWVRSVIGAAEPHRAGRYVGEADLAASPERAKECFSANAWDKLGRLRREHDPDQRFFSYLTS